MTTEQPSKESSRREILSVGQVNRQARYLLEEHFALIWVEGEISEFFSAGSGHWYFSLKDKEAELSCAMFRGDNRRLKAEPEPGDRVLLGGRLSLYEPRGRFQMIVSQVETAGLGELQRSFEALKQTLAAEGLFDPSRKQPLPKWPQHIALITSSEGAAIRDVLSVLKRRCPAILLTLLSTPVQGREAVPGILAALKLAERAALHLQPPLDVILLTRGGGSLEDLQAFNNEQVVRAIAANSLPVVCAVGHEIDFSLADMAADFRAPTPSAAAEQLSPEQGLLLEDLAGMEELLIERLSRCLQEGRVRIDWLRKRLRHPKERLQQLQQRTDDLQLRLVRGQRRQLLQLRQQPTEICRALLRTAHSNLQGEKAQLQTIAAQLELLNPKAILRRGYAVVTDELDRVVRSAAEVEKGSRVKAELGSGSLLCRVEAQKRPE